MPFEIEETGELTRKAKVTVPGGEFQSRVNKELRRLSTKVKLDGFRKGKIPMPVMQQRYGASVSREVIEELVNDHVNEVLEEAGSVLYLGTPQVSGIPGAGDGDLEFEVELEVRPDVDPIGYLGLEVDMPTPEISREAIDQELEALRHQHAETRPITLRETIAAGDIVTVDFEALSDHPELEDMKGEDVEIEVGTGQALPGIDEALEGADMGTTLEPDIELGESFPVEELRGEEIPLRLKIKKVEQRVLPEVDDDFALKTGEGETLLELRSNIRERIEESRQEQAQRYAIDNMMEKLLEQNDFDLPPKFFEQQLDQTAQRRLQMFAQQGLDPEQLGIDIDLFKEDLRDQVEQQIKAEFLLVEISRKEKIDVEEEDLRQLFETQAAQMGVNLQQFMAFARQDEDLIRQASAQVLLNKTQDHLLSEATINEVDWSVLEASDEEEEEEQEEVEASDEEEVEASEEEEVEASDEEEEEEEVEASEEEDDAEESSEEEEEADDEEEE